MIDATILIPTHRHPALLAYAVQSALAQEGVSIELFVVGDGVEDDTRHALAPFHADERLSFFDRPKGERHGERHRHDALARAAGRIVCYLSDDDLLLPEHAAAMLEVLVDADFAHSAPFVVEPGSGLAYVPFDLAQEPQQDRLRRGGWNAFGLTGAAHTLAAYRRLPWGWRPAPKGVFSDLHMWRQFLDLPCFRGVTNEELTHLTFPNPTWSELPLEERVASLESWSKTIKNPDGRRRLAWEARRTRVARTAAINLYADDLEGFTTNLTERLVASEAQLKASEAQLAESEARVAELRAFLETIEASRAWKLRNRLLSLSLVRALVERLPSAR